MKMIRTTLSVALLSLGLAGTASAADIPGISINPDSLKQFTVSAKFVEPTPPLEGNYEPNEQNNSTGKLGLDTVLGQLKVNGTNIIGVAWADNYVDPSNSSIGVMLSENGSDSIKARFASDTSTNIGADQGYTIFENTADTSHTFKFYGAEEKSNVKPGNYTAVINIVEAQK